MEVVSVYSFNTWHWYWYGKNSVTAIDVFGLEHRAFVEEGDRSYDWVIVVLLVFHEALELILSVSAVRTEEGVFGIDVALLLFEPKGEGGGVNSLQLSLPSFLLQVRDGRDNMSDALFLVDNDEAIFIVSKNEGRVVEIVDEKL